MRCILYQWLISRALDGGGRLPLRHMQKCQSCRRFYQRSVLLVRELRAEAQALAPAPPQVRPARSWRGHLAVAAGVVAAAAAAWAIVAILTAPRAPGPGAAAPPRARRPAPAGRPAVAALPGALPTRMTGELESVAEAAKAPLVRQVHNISDTAADAGRTLLSCLPISMPPPPQE